MLNDQDKENGIFINGKQQIIEMLKFMNSKERNDLIRNIKARNPSMAKELSEQCFSFNDLARLNDDQLTVIFNSVNPYVLGLALYLAPLSFQRRTLSMISRDRAEKAYEILSKNLESKRHECSKAQDKIIFSAVSLSKNGQLNLMSQG